MRYLKFIIISVVFEIRRDPLLYDCEVFFLHSAVLLPSLDRTLLYYDLITISSQVVWKIEHEVLIVDHRIIIVIIIAR